MGTEGTPLLNDDGTASMATMFMSSHHAFRRDLLCLRAALARIASGDRSAATDVAARWTAFREALHGHHTIEDTAMFPGMRAGDASLAPLFDRLSADHHRVDPLLAEGDVAFAESIRAPSDAARVVDALEALLTDHLALEERHVIPLIRAAHEFPTPPTPEVAAMYADGFSWSLHGLAPDVVDRVLERLPSNVKDLLPDARARFAASYARAFGAPFPAASRTSVPAGRST